MYSHSRTSGGTGQLSIESLSARVRWHCAMQGCVTLQLTSLCSLRDLCVVQALASGLPFLFTLWLAYKLLSANSFRLDRAQSVTADPQHHGT